MLTPRKKHSAPTEQKRTLMLILALLLLAAIITAAALASRSPVEEASPVPTSSAVRLIDASPADIVSLTIRRGSEAPWTAIPNSPGKEVTIHGETSITPTWEECAAFLRSAASITAEEVLTTDPTNYADHLSDYGLDNPRYEARILYADGTEVTLRIGDQGPDGTWRYMLVNGDDRLFAFSNGSVESLFVNCYTLRKVSQPDLHKARIDRITLTQGDRVIQWALQGRITDADAIDKWRIASPFSYPADSSAMQSLLSSAANLRLAAWVAPATDENLHLYGFDAPRLTIELHQAAGTIAVTGTEGATQAVDFPESTVSFVIGGEKNDMVDYILFGDDIYLSSHFTMGVFMDYDVTATMSRYPLMTALGNLATLTIREGDVVTNYTLTRTEQVAANNELVTDEDGNLVCTVTVTRNGTTLDYAAFEAAYNALALVTVSGILPQDESVTAEPHTVYTFTDVDDTVHTVALATFDILHDAVFVDGNAAFYLIKGGFQLRLD